MAMLHTKPPNPGPPFPPRGGARARWFPDVEALAQPCRLNGHLVTGEGRRRKQGRCQREPVPGRHDFLPATCNEEWVPHVVLVQFAMLGLSTRNR
ncbi:hypothetical protein FKM82_008502 [Ascaphus truei]